MFYLPTYLNVTIESNNRQISFLYLLNIIKLWIAIGGTFPPNVFRSKSSQNLFDAKSGIRLIEDFMIGSKLS